MLQSIGNKNKKAFSLIEVMVSLIVMTIIMAAFVPIVTKRANQKLQSGFIKQEGDCAYISSRCHLCDTRQNTCLSCELSCIDDKTLNYNKCVCE